MKDLDLAATRLSVALAQPNYIIDIDAQAISDIIDDWKRLRTIISEEKPKLASQCDIERQCERIVEASEEIATNQNTPQWLSQKTERAIKYTESVIKYHKQYGTITAKQQETLDLFERELNYIQDET